MTGDGRLVEVQATAEKVAFARERAGRAARPRGRRHRADRGAAARACEAPSCLTSRWVEVLLRLTLAGALGGAIGLERELRDREAGLRTHLLVAVGSALFTLVSRVRLPRLRLRPGDRVHARPDAHRGADRHRHRLPRCRRDHPPGHLDPRADDGGDALDRRRDRARLAAPATTRRRHHDGASCSSRSIRCGSSPTASSTPFRPRPGSLLGRDAAGRQRRRAARRCSRSTGSQVAVVRGRAGRRRPDRRG